MSHRNGFIKNRNIGNDNRHSEVEGGDRNIGNDNRRSEVEGGDFIESHS